LNAPIDDADARTRRSWLGLLVPALLAFAALLWLGTWQLQRKAWKEALIASLTERLAAPPMALPPPATWPTLDSASNEYRRVKFRAEFENDKEALVYATASAFRPDISGQGFWVFTPARLEDGSLVVVNRGFVPNDLSNSATRPAGQISGIVETAGAMRWADARHWFTPNDDPIHNLWFLRDPATIAAAKGWAHVSPFYVEEETPMPPGGLPRPGRLVVNLPDNHLQYAITWYGLALVLAVVFVTWAFSSSARRRPS
jgi:surfeit locus 1 family protein